MAASWIVGAVLAVTIICLPFGQTQLLSSLPDCIQDCINQSQDDNCKASDLGCLCRASAGNFLPDLITCMHGNCDNSLDTNLLLTPLQYLCDIAGTPIPASALRNAENLASSLATQVTTTVTLGEQSASGSAGITTTVESLSLSLSTVTVTTTKSGATLDLVFPITLERTTTVTGAPSTVTRVSTDGFTELIPVVIISTDRAGSTFTTTTNEPGAVSTYTTTDSAGRTTTETSTYTETSASMSVSSESGTDSSYTTTTKSVAAEKTSSSTTKGSGGSQTSSAASEDSTNSSPFKDTNSFATREGVGRWLSLTTLLMFGCIWF